MSSEYWILFQLWYLHVCLYFHQYYSSRQDSVHSTLSKSGKPNHPSGSTTHPTMMFVWNAQHFVAGASRLSPPRTTSSYKAWANVCWAYEQPKNISSLADAEHLVSFNTAEYVVIGQNRLPKTVLFQSPSNAQSLRWLCLRNPRESQRF